MHPTPVKDSEKFDEADDGFESDNEDPNVFKIRGALNPPSAKLLSTSELHALIHDGHIDLNPPYQRDVVWPEIKQIGLIDSIFRNFYIPPVVFAVQRDEDDEEIRICVDGKQRLTSIQKFFDGQIPHRDVKTKRSYWYTRSEAQKGRLDVPDEHKAAFASKMITCVEYYDLAPGTERDIFQRVQLGMTLTAAEKLQAIASPWAEWISDLEARHVVCEGGLAQVLEWDTRRGRDFQCLAQFIFCCDGLPEQLFPTAPKMEKWLLRLDGPGHAFKSVINGVLNEFSYIATEQQLQFGFKTIDKRLAPVEFVFIGVLLYVLRDESHEDRASAIHALRVSVRDQFADVRTNTKVGNALWKFIGEIQSNPHRSHYRSGGSSSQSKSGKKRKKMDKEDRDYELDDYKPTPVRNLGNTPKTRSKATKYS